MSEPAVVQGILRPFDGYFEDAAIPKPVQARAERMAEAISAVIDDAIVDCFVSEYMNDDATRTFESVWLFTDRALLEGDFRDDDDDFDYVVFRKNVVHVVAYRRAFDMRTASEASRLSLDVTLNDQIEGTMRATGQNCIWLARILKSRIIPNMRNGE